MAHPVAARIREALPGGCGFTIRSLGVIVAANTTIKRYLLSMFGAQLVDARE